MSTSRRAGKSFPKSARLRTRSEFLRVQNGGFKVSTEHLLGVALQRDQAPPRVGLTVSRKVGPAVVRNRIRRRLREIYRHRQQVLPAGVDLVLIARPSAATADSVALARSVDVIFQRLSRQFK